MNPEQSASPSRSRTGVPTRVCPPASRVSARRAAIAALVVAGLAGGCKLPTFGQNHGATTQAQHENFLYQGFFVAGIVVGVIVLCLIIWSILRYRRRDDSIPKQTAEHIPLEVFYTVVPLLIVFVLFGATVITENKVDALNKPDVSITVSAYQWGWRFCYGNYNLSTNVCSGVQNTTQNVVIGNASTYPAMYVPTGETVQITLVSLDVIHGFYVRDLNFSRYAQPGLVNKFDLNFTKTGTFIGQCTQFCGLQHDLMYFKIISESPADYATWYSNEQSQLQTTTTSASGGTQ